MKGDLEINGIDVYERWGCSMGDNFLNTLLDIPPLKGFIENKGARSHGKQVMYDPADWVDERNITLTFTLIAKSPEELLVAKAAFEVELLHPHPPLGGMELRVPSIQPDVYYHLTYLSSASFAFSGSRCSCKLSVRFNEPNPKDRNKKEACK
jgi:hypothetical protein